jgi:hypothetical protein
MTTVIMILALSAITTISFLAMRSQPIKRTVEEMNADEAERAAKRKAWIDSQWDVK